MRPTRKRAKKEQAKFEREEQSNTNEKEILNIELKSKVMSLTERQEHAAIERMSRQKQSSAYVTARKANIPVTVVRGDTIYRVTKEGREAIGRVEPKVRLTQRTIVLK